MRRTLYPQIRFSKRMERYLIGRIHLEAALAVDAGGSMSTLQSARIDPVFSKGTIHLPLYFTRPDLDKILTIQRCLQLPGVYQCEINLGLSVRSQFQLFRADLVQARDLLLTPDFDTFQFNVRDVGCNGRVTIDSASIAQAIDTYGLIFFNHAGVIEVKFQRATGNPEIKFAGIHFRVGEADILPISLPENHVHVRRSDDLCKVWQWLDFTLPKSA